MGRRALGPVGGLLLSWASLTAAETPLLFDRDEPLELTLEAPMRTLLRQESSDGADLDACLRLGEGACLPIRLSTFGKSRLEECQLPPLLIVLEPEAAAGTPFAGHSTLRLVTHCRRHPVYERAVLLEYLAYRSYAVVAEPALRVRLAEVRYQDTEGRTETDSRRGFFVEDIAEAAKRLGLTWSSFAHQRIDDLDPERAAVYFLFQFMIGNTDWSAVTGPEGEPCCHNTAVLEDSASGARFLLPYDFDQSGLVGAPYAVPAERLGVSSVKVRVYRGFCKQNEELTAAVEHFNRRRSELETLFEDDSLPEEKARQAAWKYVAGFYDLVNRPKKLESAIVRRCRGRSDR